MTGSFEGPSAGAGMVVSTLHDEGCMDGNCWVGPGTVF